MKCPKCGYTNKEDIHCCNMCGEVLQKARAAQEQPEGLRPETNTPDRPCPNHPYKSVEGFCRACNQEFCTECLGGATGMGICVACRGQGHDLSASGMRTVRKRHSFEKNFLVTWKAIITNPFGFFEGITKSDTVGYPLLFTYVNAVVGILPMLLLIMVAATALPFLPGGLSIVLIIPILILYLIFITIALCFGSCLVHLCAKVMGGDGDLVATIKVYAYGWAVLGLTQVFNVIPLVSLLAAIPVFLYFVFLMIVGVKNAHDLSYFKAAVAVIIMPIVFSCIFGLLMMLFCRPSITMMPM